MQTKLKFSTNIVWVKNIFTHTIILFFIFMGLSCVNFPTYAPPCPNEDAPCDCPPIPYTTGIVIDTIGIRWGFKHKRLSPDGKWLLFNETDAMKIRLLNLETGERRDHNFFKFFPDNEHPFVYSSPIWCPYDPTKFAFTAGVAFDSTDDGRENPTLYNYGFYIGNIDGTELQKITPDECGPYGTEQGTLYNWLIGSKPGLDSFTCLYCIYKQGSKRWMQDSVIDGIYIPQQQRTLHTDLYEKVIYQNPQVKDEWISLERDIRTGESFLSLNLGIWGGGWVNIDGFKFNTGVAGSPILSGVSWSPNGKELAVEFLHQDTDNKHNRYKIAIVDMNKVRYPPSDATRGGSFVKRMIDLRREFCMGTLWGSGPEYITDSTLAVSMYTYRKTMQSDRENIYEITNTGRLIRQLTFY